MYKKTLQIITFLCCALLVPVDLHATQVDACKKQCDTAKENLAFGYARDPQMKLLTIPLLNRCWKQCEQPPHKCFWFYPPRSEYENKIIKDAGCQVAHEAVDKPLAPKVLPPDRASTTTPVIKELEYVIACAFAPAFFGDKITDPAEIAARKVGRQKVLDLLKNKCNYDTTPLVEGTIRYYQASERLSGSKFPATCAGILNAAMADDDIARVCWAGIYDRRHRH